MQLDFTQFLSKIEKISPVPLKHLPDREYVDVYVKAYYLPDNIMEEFIQSHPVSLAQCHLLISIFCHGNLVPDLLFFCVLQEYNSQQLKTLVNCALQGNKRSKQRLLTIIEEMEKGSKR